MSFYVALVSFILSIVLFPHQISGGNLTPVVKTKSGKVVGNIVPTSEGEFAQFLGIPYAKPPIGSLRLQPTKPVDDWDDVLKATEEPNHCWQPRVNIGSKRWTLSEDCLYLNILTPTSVFDQGKSKLLPVIVSLGTSYSFDFAESHEFEKTAYPFVLRENIIDVIVRYRLGFFGFPYSSNEKDGIISNLGLWDQNMALHWIKDNIKSFGGDPDRVTIVGTGGGGGLVDAHLYSPYARGLFQNSVTESRQVIGLFSFDTNTLPTEESTNIVIDRVGCGKAKDKIACLQDLDPKTIVSSYPNRQFAFNPTPDGEYIPLDYESQPPNGENHLRGFVEDLGSFPSIPFAPEIFTKQDFALEDARDVISRIYEGDSVDKITNLYIGSATDDLSLKKIQEGLIRFLTDIFYACPAFLAAEFIAEGQTRGKTYVFQFNHMPNSHLFPVCDLQNELRGCYLNIRIFTSGLPFVDSPQVFNWKDIFTPQDRMVSEKMIRILGNFVKSG